MAGGRVGVVGVVGAGNIGVGVATDLAMHGLQSVIVDLSNTILCRARDEILRNVRCMPLVSPALPRVSRSDALDRLEFTTRLEDLATCDFIVENVTEDWSIKRQVYEQLARIAKPGARFGANTSCISITQIAAVTGRPAHVVGVHFMNPVPLMPTVEVVRGLHTSDETLGALEVLLQAMGKEAIVVGDLPGFVSNRISHLFMNEAAFVLQDGVATPAAIDAIFRKCFGHRMGPLETADLIGIDTVVRSLDVLYESYHDPKYRCCPLMRKLAHAGYLGRKTGRGFHVYREVAA